MKGSAYLIKPGDRAPTEVPISLPPGPGEIHGYLDDYLQLVPFFRQYRNQRAVAFVGEHSKICDNPTPNPGAQVLWEVELLRQGINPQRVDDFLFGNVIILTGDDTFMEAL